MNDFDSTPDLKTETHKGADFGDIQPILVARGYLDDVDKIKEQQKQQGHCFTQPDYPGNKNDHHDKGWDKCPDKTPPR